MNEAPVVKPMSVLPYKMLPDIKPRPPGFDPVTGFGKPLYTKRGQKQAAKEEWAKQVVAHW
jgi:hypothetical protein